MKYCTHCGKQLFDEAVLCVGCGCPVAGTATQSMQAQVQTVDGSKLVTKLSQRVNTNGIIWLVIGIIQAAVGFLFSYWILAVGVMNIIAGIQNMRYSKTMLSDASGIVAKFTPLAGPIIALIYNIVIGGLIGVAGSIYYFVAIRGFVMENQHAFSNLGKSPKPQYFAGSAMGRPVNITPPTEGMWACQYCGTHNKSAYGQCKKCGQYRGK